MSDGPVRVWWPKHGHVWHWRPTCGVRRFGDQRESDLAVLALPKLRAEGRHACLACSRAGRLPGLRVEVAETPGPLQMMEAYLAAMRRIAHDAGVTREEARRVAENFLGLPEVAEGHAQGSGEALEVPAGGVRLAGLPAGQGADIDLDPAGQLGLGQPQSCPGRSD